MGEKDLTVTEAARRLGIHPNTLRQWVDRGMIEAVILPGSGYRRFKPEIVDALRAKMETGNVEVKNAA